MFTRSLNNEHDYLGLNETLNCFDSEPNRTEPNQTKPNQTKPNQTTTLSDVLLPQYHFEVSILSQQQFTSESSETISPRIRPSMFTLTTLCSPGQLRYRDPLRKKSLYWRQGLNIEKFKGLNLNKPMRKNIFIKCNLF